MKKRNKSLLLVVLVAARWCWARWHWYWHREAEERAAEADAVEVARRRDVVAELETLAPQRRHGGAINEIRSAAATATDHDRATVNEIIAFAKSGRKETKIYSLTPATCALLFLTGNGYDRAWHASGAKSAITYARRMQNGEWDWNAGAIGLYGDGTLSDGRHRLSGAALARVTLTTSITFAVRRPRSTETRRQLSAISTASRRITGAPGK
jgi:hypothetical protein